MLDEYIGIIIGGGPPVVVLLILAVLWLRKRLQREEDARKEDRAKAEEALRVERERVEQLMQDRFKDILGFMTDLTRHLKESNSMMERMYGEALKLRPEVEELVRATKHGGR